MCCNADSKFKERNTKIFSLVSNQNDMSDYQMIEEEEITIPITE